MECFPHGITAEDKVYTMNKVALTIIQIFSVAAIALYFHPLKDKTIGYAEATNSSEESSHKGGVITVGSISPAIKEKIAKCKPFADYLADRLRAEGISRGRVLVATSMAEMAIFMKKGEVDLYIGSLLPIIELMQLSGAKPFLRRWKNGVAEYQSVIFVRKDSRIKTLEDLKGKMIAFDESYSTSGYLLPKATLMQEGLILIEYDNVFSQVPLDRVGYVFSHDDENTMFWVLKGRVPAGATDIISFYELAGVRRDELRILLKSIDVPRQVVAHRGDLSPGLVTAIEGVLLSMDEDLEGKAILNGFQNTKKFDKFPEGVEKAFKPIKGLMKFIEK